MYLLRPGPVSDVASLLSHLRSAPPESEMLLIAFHTKFVAADIFLIAGFTLKSTTPDPK